MQPTWRAAVLQGWCPFDQLVGWGSCRTALTQTGGGLQLFNGGFPLPTWGWGLQSFTHGAPLQKDAANQVGGQPLLRGGASFLKNHSRHSTSFLGVASLCRASASDLGGQQLF